MKRINEGMIQKAPLQYVKRVREEIIDACEELLEIGARVRPLIVGTSQVGWVRGLHVTERKMLKRWLHNPNNFIFHALCLATSLPPEEIENLNTRELANLAEVVKQMGEYDLSLYPFLSAYVTTMSSENLWHGRGTLLTSFENRTLGMPDGKQIKILVPSDHAKLWASLCTYREQAKKRLDENWNALLIIRPWAGKEADPLAGELRSFQKQLMTDSMAPWENIIRTQHAVDASDGWAHADDTLEGLQRELKGMLSNDRHERLIEKFEHQMRDQAEEKKQQIEKLMSERGGPGVVTGEISVSSEAEVLKRQHDIKKGRPVILPVRSQITSSAEEKIQRYK